MKPYVEAAQLRWHDEHAFALGVPRISEFARAVADSERVIIVLSLGYRADPSGSFVTALALSRQLDGAIATTLPIVIGRVDIPPLLANLEPIYRDSADVLVRIGERLRRPIPPQFEKPPCPYPGLRAVEQDLCGRDLDVAGLLRRVAQQPRVFLIGPSGVGKTSLLRAGLIPALEQPVTQMRPGARPADSLAALNPPSGSVLVIDQFEEAFTVADIEQRRSFFEALASLTNIKVIASLRSDFFSELIESSLWPVAIEQRYELGPLTAEGIRAAITEPAGRVGVAIEPGLVATLELECRNQPGALPLLQETLARLWALMRLRLIAETDYTGSIVTQLAFRADAGINELSAEARTVARRCLVMMVQFGAKNTRRRVSLTELYTSAPEDHELVDRTLDYLVSLRLVSADGEKRELAHEALIDGWPTFQGWIEESRAAELVRRRLLDKLEDWEKYGSLLDAAEIREAERFARNELSWDALSKLIAKSRGRLRLVRAIGVAAVLALTAITIVALRQCSFADEERGRADELRRLAEARARTSLSRQLAMQGTGALDGVPGLGLLLGVEAWRASDTYEARSELFNALQRDPLLGAAIGFGTDTPLSIAKRHDGVLAIVTAGGSLHFWDPRTHERHLLMADHSGMSLDIHFSPDDRWLATSGDDGKIVIRDAQTGIAIRTLDSGTRDSSIEHLAFSADSSLLFASERSKAVIAPKHHGISIWRVDDGSLITLLPSDDAPVTGVAIDQEHGTVFAATETGVLRWMGGSWTPMPPLRDHETKKLSGLMLDGHGKLASIGDDHFVLIWDLAKNQEPPRRFAVGGMAHLRSLAFNSDGSSLATAEEDGTVRSWTIGAAQPASVVLGRHRDIAEAVGFLGDGKSVVSVGWDHAMYVWGQSNVSTLALTHPAHAKEVNAVAYSPDSSILAAGGSDGCVSIWTGDGALQLKTLSHGGVVMGLAFDKGAKHLASGGTDRRVKIWNASNWTLAAEHSHDSEVRRIAFGENSLAVALESGDVAVWDLTTNKRRLDIYTGLHQITDVSIAPSGELIATAYKGSRVGVWSVETGQPIGAPIAITGETIGTASLGLSGLLVTGSDPAPVRVWSLATRMVKSQVTIEPITAFSLKFAPDAARVAVGGYGAISLWDISRGDALTLKLDADAAVQEVAFSPDGRRVAAARSDGNLTVWVVDPADWAKQACRIAGRNLSITEWKKSIPDVPYCRSCPEWPADPSQPGAAPCAAALASRKN